MSMVGWVMIFLWGVGSFAVGFYERWGGSRGVYYGGLVVFWKGVFGLVEGWGWGGLVMVGWVVGDRMRKGGGL